MTAANTNTDQPTVPHETHPQDIFHTQYKHSLTSYTSYQHFRMQNLNIYRAISYCHQIQDLLVLVPDIAAAIHYDVLNMATFVLL